MNVNKQITVSQFNLHRETGVLYWDFLLYPTQYHLTHISRKQHAPIQRKKVDVFDFLHFHTRRAPKCPEESCILKILKKNLGVLWRPPKVSNFGLFECWAVHFFLIQKLQNSKKLRLIIDNQGLIYLPITKSPGLLAPTAENPAMNYEWK
jgi:hypothetical protein